MEQVTKVRVSRKDRAIIREQKKAARIAAKEQARQELHEQRSWEKFVERMKACGAWIEE